MRARGDDTLLHDDTVALISYCTGLVNFQGQFHHRHQDEQKDTRHCARDEKDGTGLRPLASLVQLLTIMIQYCKYLVLKAKEYMWSMKVLFDEKESQLQ